MQTPLLLSAAVLLTALSGELPDLRIGDAMPLPTHKMMDVSGSEVALDEISRPNGTLVIFSCNTCPFVIGSEDSEGWEGRYPALAGFCTENDVGFVLVNSNEAKRGKGDGYEDMKLHYKEHRYQQYYLLDKDHVLADAFGARTTPHVFLFDKTGRLVYKGAIDDSVESAKQVTRNYVRDAIASLVAGRPIEPATTRNIGCSIKRVAAEH
ncbi:MAG: thioredoxin family protein [Flavobacteriales bacterium]|nr:thioredoxin family protein [Flavobacteriales bacterium]MCB9166962.1 thioredoxin family protein [Flavobacteriales bacterium]